MCPKCSATFSTICLGPSDHFSLKANILCHFWQELFPSVLGHWLSGSSNMALHVRNMTQVTSKNRSHYPFLASQQTQTPNQSGHQRGTRSTFRCQRDRAPFKRRICWKNNHRACPSWNAFLGSKETPRWFMHLMIFFTNRNVAIVLFFMWQMLSDTDMLTRHGTCSLKCIKVPFVLFSITMAIKSWKNDCFVNIKLPKIG